MKDKMINTEDNNILNLLVNRELSSVEFVRDYYQLRFDGLTLNVISKSIIVEDGLSYDDSSEKFCYLIKRCINQIILQVNLVPENSITLVFDNNLTLIISLKPEDYRSAEALIFFDDESKIWEVW